MLISFILELNNRKILEDLQHKKQLILQKGVSPVVGVPVNNANHIASSMPLVAHAYLPYTFAHRMKSI